MIIPNFMAITTGIHSGVTGTLAQVYANLIPQRLSAASSLFQAGTHGMQLRDIKEFENIHQSQTIFNSVNGAWVFWEAKQLVKLAIPLGLCSTTVLGSVALLTASIVLPRLLRDWMDKQYTPDASARALLERSRAQIPEADRGFVTLGWQRPGGQRFAQFLYGMRLVTNVALTVLSPSYRLYFFLNACAMVYSLAKVSQIQWVSFSRNFNVHSEDGGSLSLNLRHYFPLRPYQGAPVEGEAAFGVPAGEEGAGVQGAASAAGEVREGEADYVEEGPPAEEGQPVEEGAPDGCPICQGADRVNVYFCKTHAFHLGCFMGWVNTKVADIGLNSTYRITQHYSNGVHTGDSCSMGVPENRLPACPQCRDRPGQFSLEASIAQCTQGTSIIIERNADSTPKLTLWSSKIVENISVTYTAFQSSFSWLVHTRPELIAQVLATQNILIFSDIAALIADIIALEEQARVQRSLAPEAKREAEARFAFRSRVIATVAFVAFTAFCLYRYMRPALDLKEILASHISVPVQEAQGIALSWGRPLAEKISLAVCFSRMATNLYGACLDPQPILKLAKAAFLSFSFIRAVELPWIRWDQTVSEHLSKDVDPPKMTFYFLPSSQASFPSVVQSIHQYVSSFFEGGTWTARWKAYTISHVPVWWWLEEKVQIREAVAAGSGAIPYLGAATGKCYNFVQKAQATLSLQGLKNGNGWLDRVITYMLL